MFSSDVSTELASILVSMATSIPEAWSSVQARAELCDCVDCWDEEEGEAVPDAVDSCWPSERKRGNVMGLHFSNGHLHGLCCLHMWCCVMA